ncbi:MAG: gliding motility-associated C-terminal domain-containing protein [Bacteroidia bacterium]|nr:gliding motility-associated C-terminal domain-containing protein [Bacteroidia bacterium]
MNFIKSKYLITLLFLSFIAFYCNGQNQNTGKGKDFWFGIMENYALPANISIYIVADKPVTFTIAFPKLGPPPLTFTLVKNRDTVINFTSTTPVKNFQLHNTGSEAAQNRGIHVTCNEPINVIVLNDAVNSTDGAAIIPTSSLLKNGIYYINTFRGEAKSIGSIYNSECLIAATEDNTEISFIPSVKTVGGKIAGNTYKTILNAGQVYQIQAADSLNLTGTKVWVSNGCKKIAVFQGAKCSQIYYGGTCNGCDHLYSQAWPTDIWGKTYLTHPFADMPNGYMFQVIASQNNTKVLVDGTLKATLNEGQAYLEDVTFAVMKCIVTDKPAAVVEFMKSGVCNGNSRGLGNPSLMNVVPIEKMTRAIQVTTPVTQNLINEIYIGIIVKNNAKSLLTINNVLVDTTKFSASASCANYVSGSFKVNKGIYNIKCDSAFSAYIYCNSDNRSYAMEIGAIYDNSSYNFKVDPFSSIYCDTTQNFKFTAFGDSAQSFTWNFGDGTTGSGNTVNKTYSKSGDFSVKLFAKLKTTGCSDDTITKVISIRRSPDISLGKDTTLCNGKVMFLAPFAKSSWAFKWNNGSTLRTQSFLSSQKVWLTVTDSNRCSSSDTISIKFKNCDSLELKIPNIFTPGGDELNDFFNFKFSGYDEFKGFIYNRWGVVVYTFNYPDKDFWNGNIENKDGEPCSDGTYYYIVTARQKSNGIEKQSNGVITLIRGK